MQTRYRYRDLFCADYGHACTFLYEWTGKNFIAGLFTPVNESIWEHMKLIFFPMLAYAIYMIRKLQTDNPSLAPALCLGILCGTAAIPICFYAYTNIIGRHIFIWDIGIFIFSTIIAFCLAYHFAKSCCLNSCAVLLYILTGILFLCFAVFSYCPPDLALFGILLSFQTKFFTLPVRAYHK